MERRTIKISCCDKTLFIPHKDNEIFLEELLIFQDDLQECCCLDILYIKELNAWKIFDPHNNLGGKQITRRVKAYVDNKARTCRCCKKSDMGKPKFKMCSRCKSSYYCSKECQKKDFENHKLICNKDF